jgi:Predicted acyltransferases
MNSRVYETLNAMRGLAAIMVVLFHSDDLLGYQLAPGGYLAVDLFFVLSGFVIAHAYEHKLAGGELSATRFALVRIIRFYPLLALGVLIGTAKALSGVVLGSPTAMPLSDIGVATASSLLLLPAPLDTAGNLFVLNVPLWTLCFELVVNLLYGALRQRLSSAVLWVIVVLGAAVMAFYAMSFGNNDNGAVVHTAIGGLARAAFGFALGVLLFRSKLALTIGFAPVLAILALALLAPVQETLRPFFDLGFAFFLAPLLVVTGASVEPKGSWARVASYLGTLSFALYAIHHPILVGSQTISEKFGIPALAMGISVLAGLLIACPILDRFYDAPIRHALRRKFLAR